MSKISGGKSLIAFLSLLTISAALSVGVAKAAEEVTEDQILRALTPVKEPLTRGLSTGPQTQTDPAAAAAEGRFVQTLRNRPTRSLSVTEREEIAAIVKDKPKILKSTSTTTQPTSAPSRCPRCRLWAGRFPIPI